MPHAKSTEAKIIEYLSGRVGEAIQIRVIASAVNLSEASVKITLTDMATRGRIRSSSSSGRAAFYMPTDEQVRNEERARQSAPAWTPEHKVSKERVELYARLQQERDAYHSIG